MKKLVVLREYNDVQFNRQLAKDEIIEVDDERAANLLAHPGQIVAEVIEPTTDLSAPQMTPETFHAPQETDNSGISEEITPSAGETAPEVPSDNENVSASDIVDANNTETLVSPSEQSEATEAAPEPSQLELPTEPVVQSDAIETTDSVASESLSELTPENSTEAPVSEAATETLQETETPITPTVKPKRPRRYAGAKKNQKTVDTE